MHVIAPIIILATFGSFASQTASAQTDRRVYLNGRDISSAKHQELQKVDIQIDGSGNIFILAPHYEVIEESSYVPLSKNPTQFRNYPQHQKAKALRPEKTKPDSKTLPPLSKDAMNPASEKVAEDKDDKRERAKIPPAVTNP